MDRGAWLVTVHGVPSVRHDLVAKPLMPALHGFSSSHVMDVRAGLYRKLSAKELMLLNCGIGEDS